MPASAAVSAALLTGGIVVGAVGAQLFIRPKQLVVSPANSIEASKASKVDLTSSSLPVQYDERLIGGYPGPVADFLRHAAYVSSFDRAKRHPHWTAEHLTADSIKPPSDQPRGDRSRSVFREDERVPALFRSVNADYFRSGYDRGHMVPAADAKSSQAAMDQTFYLTNIAPQVGEGFNRDYWAHTEDFVRRLTQKFRDVYVFTIPLYLPRQGIDGKWRISYEVIGNPPNVHVPTHFAKVIYAHGTPSTGGVALGKAVGLQSQSGLGAFVLPNAVIPNDAPLRSFAVPVDAVERASGLLLFPPAIKTNTRSLCDAIDCQIIVRDFSDRNRQQKIPQISATTSKSL